MESFSSARPIPMPESYHIDERTLGINAVTAVDFYTFNQIKHYQNLRDLKLAEDIAGQKNDPANLPPIARTIGQIEGHTMTAEEARFVSDMRDWQELVADVDVDGLFEKHKAEIHTHLKGIRANLSDLDEGQSNQLDSYIAQNAPVVLLNMKRPEESPISKPSEIREESFSLSGWITWLSENASDKELINFLQWHVYQLSEQQVATELDSGINVQKARYKEALAQGIYDGWLSHKAAEAIKEVDNIRVLFGDVFDTIFRDIGGYHIPGTSYVVLAQGVGSERMRRLESAYSSVDHALWHELNHAVLGKRDASAEDTTGGMRERWLDEALTEHINLVLKGLDPRARSSYTAERLLFRTLLSKGSKIIDASVGTRAYSGDTAEQQEFYGVLDESWGANVVPAVSKAITKCENALLAEGIKLRLAQTRAVEKVTDKLINNPRAIFGAEWVRPGKLEVMAA